MKLMVLRFILQELLKSGYIIQIVSKVNGKSLRVLENGKVDCLGETGTACECVRVRVCVRVCVRACVCVRV